MRFGQWWSPFFASNRAASLHLHEALWHNLTSCLAE